VVEAVKAWIKTIGRTATAKGTGIKACA